MDKDVHLDLDKPIIEDLLPPVEESVPVETVEVSAEPVVSEEPDRSAYNCVPCKGEGLLPAGTVCAACNGTGKI